MTGTALAWIGLALVIGTGTVWFRRAQAVNLPKDRTRFVAAMVIGVLLGILAFALGTGGLAGIPAGLAVFGGGIFLLLVSISAQKGGSGKFRLGAPVPEFSAPDENGEDYRVSSAPESRSC